MESILYQLFSGNYDITPKLDKTQQELVEQITAEWDKIQQAFGREFVDHLGELEGEREDWRNFQYYCSGFVLGVRLMLEALG